jgi:hypothetical protein
LTHQWPNWGALWPLTLITMGLLFLGGWFFLARVGEMVDEL